MDSEYTLYFKNQNKCKSLNVHLGRTGKTEELLGLGLFECTYETWFIIRMANDGLALVNKDYKKNFMIFRCFLCENLHLVFI